MNKERHLVVGCGVALLCPKRTRPVNAEMFLSLNHLYRVELLQLLLSGFYTSVYDLVFCVDFIDF